jgi:dsDNA-specific endonuclease/ATPase MutS2
MILAGMNAEGKTTLLKSIVNLLLLGQSLGICNASEVNITPYDKIYCIIDVYSDPEKIFPNSKINYMFQIDCAILITTQN